VRLKQQQMQQFKDNLREGQMTDKAIKQRAAGYLKLGWITEEQYKTVLRVVGQGNAIAIRKGEGKANVVHFFCKSIATK
jgi:hypothetical protein